MAPNPAPALCLDLTRLTRRIGRGPLTGIDRVELAWARYLVTHQGPVFGLVRSSLGFLLLDRVGIEALVGWADGVPIPRSRDMFSLLRKLRGGDRSVETALAQLAIGRTHRLALKRLLTRKLPQGSIYLNTGHSNLHRRVIEACRAVGKVGVLIHDTIPLDLPKSQRPGASAEFARKLKLVSELADAVFYVSAASQAAAELHLARFGRIPPGYPALISITPPQPDPTLLPTYLTKMPKEPYFVTVGTIEPRKDHALLLDVWEDLAKRTEFVPELLIIGRRGWQNYDVFRRLDELNEQPLPKVRELSGLPDAAVFALLQNARALLMPSHAEGFGLPLIEAMALGTPVVACDLEAYKETVGDYAVYLPKGESYRWRATVEEMVADASLGVKPARPPIPWSHHFETILTTLR